jgi:murein DD-endopeptidase MepM/ murein hydrolase activator NlpD
VRKLRILLSTLLAATIWLSWAPPAKAITGVPPVPGPVVRNFDPPDQPWLAGHRGVDLLALPGTVVVAVLAGRVTFAGMIAGVPVVVVSHGDTRTTYQPVSALVEVGTAVMAGQQLGTLTAGHSWDGQNCLHLGWLRGTTYLDPSTLFDTSGLRLLPSDAAAVAVKLAAQRAAQFLSGSPGLLQQPVAGAIGSGFGMRLHPIFHVWRMHSGVDIGASCGTPIRAAADGTVIGNTYDSASGHRLTIDHGLVGGHQLVTIYLHASSYSVRVGQSVLRGQVVGKVGSTGWSTGCHLHFSVKVDGRLTNPKLYL